MISDQLLASLYPHLPAVKRALYLPMIQAACDEAGINTRFRVAAFLAQVGLESYELKYMAEIWGPTPAQLRYERPLVDGVLAPLSTDPHHQPLWQRLGNLEPGDGFKYRGIGPIQITGRANIARAGKDLGLNLECSPELGQDPAVGFRLAAWYWTKHGVDLNTYADTGTQEGFDKITLAINGGYNGKPQRDAYWVKALKLIPGSQS